MARRHTCTVAFLSALLTSSVAFGSEVTPGGNYSDFMMLTVDKSKLSAELRTWPEQQTDSRLLRTFKIAIGKAEGDKQVEGDNKTPEGVYFALNHIDGRTLPEKYGTLAIPIDFPNPIDHKEGKTGYGIWLHGVERDSRIEEAKVTEGCVAFYNKDIANLSSWLKSHQGVIVIAGDAGQVNRNEDLDAVRAATLTWMNAWANRDIDSYIAYYGEGFRNQGMNRDAYKDYKGRVFNSYKAMSVGYDHLRVITHPKYAVSLFNQDFRGDDRYISNGRKVLYWEKAEDGSWKIAREIFQSRRFEFVTFTDRELAMLVEQAPASTAEKEKKNPNL